MKQDDHSIITLPNGLRVIFCDSPNSRVTHLGFHIYAGSRDDGTLPGIAHCFEHMLFKGTGKRNAWHIINRLEAVGGEMNAFTTKEITALYATVTNDYTERAIELLADLCFSSVFPGKELEKEKKIISEEINMYLDTPEENIYDEFQEMVFEGHPLAPNILGTHETLSSIETGHLLGFHNTYYQPGNIVLSISSALPHEKLSGWVKKYCVTEKKSCTLPPRPSFKKYAPKKQQKTTDHIQCHAILGNVAYPHNHRNRHALSLLNNLLGGPGMNSRLNLSVRERYGLTYNIESGYAAFADTGLFHCYFSTDKSNLERASALVGRELKKLREKPLGTLQLHQAKKQFNGQIMLAEENRLNVMLMYGKNLVQGYPTEKLEEVMHKIDRISASQLLEIANEIFDPDALSYLAYVSD